MRVRTEGLTCWSHERKENSWLVLVPPNYFQSKSLNLQRLASRKAQKSWGGGRRGPPSCIAKCGRACSVTAVAECSSVDFSVVSRHLAIHARARGVDSSRSCRVVSYKVRFKEVHAVLTDLVKALDGCGLSVCVSGCGKNC